MHQAPGEDSCRCVVELGGVSLEERGVILPRLYKVLTACGCWTVGYRHCGARVVEYSFEVALATMVELYCGLAQAGLEMSEASHRALTELCVLRTHEQALQGSRCVTPRMVSVQLTMNFVDPDEEEPEPGVIAAEA
jgi:hypothetical protein